MIVLPHSPMVLTPNGLRLALAKLMIRAAALLLLLLLLLDQRQRVS